MVVHPADLITKAPTIKVKIRNGVGSPSDAMIRPHSAGASNR